MVCFFWELLQAAITARRRLEEEEDNYSEALKSAYIVIFPPQTSELHHLENLFGAIMLLCFCIHVVKAIGQCLKLHIQEVHILVRDIQNSHISSLEDAWPICWDLTNCWTFMCFAFGILVYLEIHQDTGMHWANFLLKTTCLALDKRLVVPLIILQI